MSRLVLRFLCFTVLVLGVFSSSSAFGQDDFCNDFGQGAGTACGVFTSTTTSTTLVTVGGIVLTVVLIVNSSKKKRALRMYFKNNAAAVARDASLGAGETLDDIRLFFAIDDSRREEFAKFIRTRRDHVVSLTRAETDDAFDGLIGQISLKFGI